MPVHHRLRFLTFPMRTSRLCSLWPDMRPLRFRRVPFGRDVAFAPGGATPSPIAIAHRLRSSRHTGLASISRVKSGGKSDDKVMPAGKVVPPNGSYEKLTSAKACCHFLCRYPCMPGDRHELPAG